ncbi:hypothetical protein V6N11_001189 [Hibiscus sabdariffa]|uniref:Uncharacterized protein n=1 Tax=Hibiscus sabdariffa TaxID=183260 RepID=A0ABR2RYZ8_9ROSI
MLKTFNEMHPPRPDRYGVVVAAAIRKQAEKPSKRTKVGIPFSLSMRSTRLNLYTDRYKKAKCIQGLDLGFIHLETQYVLCSFPCFLRPLIPLSRSQISREPGHLSLSLMTRSPRPTKAGSSGFSSSVSERNVKVERFSERKESVESVHTYTPNGPLEKPYVENAFLVSLSFGSFSLELSLDSRRKVSDSPFIPFSLSLSSSYDGCGGSYDTMVISLHSLSNISRLPFTEHE